MTTEPPCECAAAGWCPRYNRDQTQYARHLCQSSEEQRKRWAASRARREKGPGLRPSPQEIPAFVEQVTHQAPTPPVAHPTAARPRLVGQMLVGLLGELGLVGREPCDCQGLVRELDTRLPAQVYAELGRFEQKLGAWLVTRKINDRARAAVQGLGYYKTTPAASLLDEAARRCM